MIQNQNITTDRPGLPAGASGSAEHYQSLIAHVSANASRHPEYGHCDGFGKDGSCSECDRLCAEWKNGGCPPDCGDSEGEHLAFDEGVATGRARGIDVENPYGDELLAEAWATGHSVGSQEHTPND